MKKILLYVLSVLLLFAACDKEETIYGGRYYGTFYNTANQLSVKGSLGFTYGKLYLDSLVRIDTFAGTDSTRTIDTVTLTINGIPMIPIYDTFYSHDTFFNPIHLQDSINSFLLNHVVKLELDSIKKIYFASFNGSELEKLLKTMPAIDKLGICDPSIDTITSMDIEASFLGNNVVSTMKFTTTKNNNPVEVIFNGSLLE